MHFVRKEKELLLTEDTALLFLPDSTSFAGFFFFPPWIRIRRSELLTK